jgi:hypothetical protein
MRLQTCLMSRRIRIYIYPSLSLRTCDLRSAAVLLLSAEHDANGIGNERASVEGPRSSRAAAPHHENTRVATYILHGLLLDRRLELEKDDVHDRHGCGSWVRGELRVGEVMLVGSCLAGAILQHLPTLYA